MGTDINSLRNHGAYWLAELENMYEKFASSTTFLVSCEVQDTRGHARALNPTDIDKIADSVLWNIPTQILLVDFSKIRPHERCRAREMYVVAQPGRVFE